MFTTRFSALFNDHFSSCFLTTGLSFQNIGGLNDDNVRSRSLFSIISFFRLRILFDFKSKVLIITIQSSVL